MEEREFPLERVWGESGPAYPLGATRPMVAVDEVAEMVGSLAETRYASAANLFDGLQVIERTKLLAELMSARGEE